VPLGRAPRAVVPHAAAPRTPGQSLAPRPRPLAHPRPGAAIPAGAWAGLALLAAGVPLGGLVRRGRRARRALATTAPTTAAGR
jgi:hypothetical protein